jgi:predicted nucleic acid-binding protein
VTPTGGDERPPDRLVDTSVAVALVVPDHDHHEATFEAVGRLRLGLAGHAAFETFSVLTRLPPPSRRTGGAAARLLSANFPGSRFLGAEESEALLARLADHGIAGGQVYDALVGAAAKHHGVVLATRDRRAMDTYRSLDVDLEFLG